MNINITKEVNELYDLKHDLAKTYNRLKATKNDFKMEQLDEYYLEDLQLILTRKAKVHDLEIEIKTLEETIDDKSTEITNALVSLGVKPGSPIYSSQVNEHGVSLNIWLQYATPGKPSLGCSF